MIDYVKISLENIDVKHLVNLPQLEFKTEVSERTGELSNKKTAEYHFCKIIIYNDDKVLFTGSIHKLWNSLKKINAPNFDLTKNYKGFNGNQFTLNDIIFVRDHLTFLFNCSSSQMIFQNLEFGVNTNPCFKPRKFLNGLLYHKNKLFESMFNNSFYSVKHQRYIVKIYDKSKQYGMSEYTLRVEIKIRKSKEFRDIGIITYGDINFYTIEMAKGMLLRRFDEVVHYDYTIDKSTLTDRQKTALLNYSNPRYWIHELKPNYRHRYKKRLEEIICKNSQRLHEQIRKDIIQKCSIINRLSEMGIVA